MAAVAGASENAGYGGLSLVKKDGSHSQRFPLVEKRYLFGRADYCDIRINLLTVSREHAEIVVDEDNQVWVNALSNTSDTNVDRKRVDGKILLKDNDLIEIGQRQFIFHSLHPDAAPGSAKGKGKEGGPKGKTPLKQSNTPVLKPAPLRPARPAGFTNEPTKEISRASVAAALAGAKGGAAATDENVAPSATPASGGVVRPTPKVAVPSASASSNTPKPPLSSLTRPTAASAAKSSSKAAATPRGAASSSKAAPAPVDSCSKCTPKSAGAKTATRTSLGGRTPTVTMTCRCEALDMMDKEGETLEASFNDGDVSLNASQEKSSEVDSSQSSAAASSSGSEGNQFGSPAAVGVPQATTTLVFSATKLVPDLTGTSVLAARSPKLRTPPQTTGKIKGLLKTPNSVNKRRSVCFVDHRNETAYLASASNDPDFIPGIIRVKTPQPKFEEKGKSPAQDAEMEEEPAGGKKGKAKAKPAISPGKREEAGKRNQRESASPAGPNPRGSKRRRVEPSTYAGVTISRKTGKDGTSASYVQLADDAPGIEDIEAYFLDAANRMFGDLMAGTMQTPDKYFASGKWAAHPAGDFPKAAGNSGKKASGSAAPAPEPEWANEVTKTLTGNATPSKQDKAIVQEHVQQAAGFLFRSPKPSTEQVDVISACLENAAAALTDSAQKLPGRKVAKGAKQMFTSCSLPKQPWQEMMQSMHASFTPKGKGKGKADDESAAFATELWQATAPQTGGKKTARRSSTGSIKATAAAAAEEIAAPKSRRASTSSVAAKTPSKAVEAEGDFDAAAVYAETAPKTDRKASRRSSGVKASTPAKDAEMEDDFDAEAAFAEVAPKTDKKTTRRSSTGAKAVVESEVEAPKSRRSSAASAKAATPAKEAEPEADDFDASAAFAEVAPKTAERKSRRSSAGAGKTPAKVAEDDFDANAAFAEVAPKTGEKVTRRSSSAGRTPGGKAAAEEFDANAAFADIAPKSRRNSAVSAKSKTPVKDAEMEDDFDADAAFAEVAPKTDKKAARRSSTGAKAATPAKQVEEDDFDAQAAYAAVAPATAPRGARRASTGSVKAKTPAKEAEEEDFDASAVYAQVAPATTQKGGRRSLPATLPAKTPAKDPQVEAAAKQKMKSYRSAVKARTPAKAEEDFDAAAVYANVAPKTGEKAGARPSRRSSVLAKKIEAEMDMEASEEEFDANEVYAGVAPKSVSKARRASSSKAQPPAASQEEAGGSGSKRKRSTSPAAKALSPKGASPKGKSPAKEDEEEFDAAEAYASVAPQTPKRSRWSLSGLVSGVVSSVVSVGRRMSGGLVSKSPAPAKQASPKVASPKAKGASPKALSPKAKGASPKVASPKALSPPPTKEAPRVEEEETKPKGRGGRRSIAPEPAAPEVQVQEEEVKKPARRGRKSVIPEIPKEEPAAEPAKEEMEEEVSEEPVAPPPRRGRKSIVPAVVEEKVKKSGSKRKSVMPEPVEEEEEVAAPKPKKGRKSAAPKSPHVTIGNASMHYITPRKENDWRMGCDSDDDDEEEVVEEAPKKGSRAKKASASKAAAKEEVTEAAGVGGADYEAMSRAELVALAKERGIKANGKTVDIIKGLQELGAPGAAAPAPEESEAPAPKGKGARGKAAAAPEPEPVVEEPVKAAPKASRGKKAAAAKEVEPVAEPEVEVGKKTSRARKSVAPAAAQEAVEVVEEPKKASRSRKSVAPSPAEEPVEEVEAPPKPASRSRKSVAPAPVEEVEEAPKKASRSRKSVAPAVVEEPVVEEVEEPPKKVSRSRKSVAPAVLEEPVVEEKKRPARESKSTAEKKAAPKGKAAKVTAEKAEAPARRSTRRG